LAIGSISLEGGCSWCASLVVIGLRESVRMHLATICRVLTIVDYADPYTKKLLQPGQERTVVVITPEALHVAGKIIDGLVSDPDSLQLVQLRQCQLSALQVMAHMCPTVACAST
jgi:hypothetical protein